MIEQILDQRGKRYGQFGDFAAKARVAHELREVMFATPVNQGGALHHDQAEALHMICHKFARILAGNPHDADHWRDIAGYAMLIANRLEGEST